MAHSSFPVHNISPEEIQCLRSQNESHVFEKVLGAGSYGRVVKRVWRGQDVAVKVFHEREKKAFKPELEQLSRINHPNIIRLLASSAENAILVLEYAERGSLYKVLHEHDGEPVAYHSGHAVSWCLQVASGVEYLHRIKPNPIIHRDLKTPNLLLVSPSGLEVKICDFGTACDKRTEMTNNMGSAPWMAPEVFKGKTYTEKCDVYSFGIVLWEILSRQLPFHDKSMPIQIQWAVVQKERPPKIKDCPEALENLIERCWVEDMSQRPDMSQIVRYVSAIQQFFPPADEPLAFPNDGEDTAESSSYISAAASIHSTTTYPEGFATPPEEPSDIPPLPDMPEAIASPFRRRTFQDYLNENPHLRQLPEGGHPTNLARPDFNSAEGYLPSYRSDHGGPQLLQSQSDFARWPRSSPFVSHHHFQRVVGDTYCPPSESEEFKFLSWRKREKNEEKGTDANDGGGVPLMPQYERAYNVPTTLGLHLTPPEAAVPPGIAMFVPHFNSSFVQSEMSPYASTPRESEDISRQNSFTKGHRRSCSDGSSKDRATGPPDLKHRQQWGRSFSHLPIQPEEFWTRSSNRLQHPNIQHFPWEFAYDMSLLDRDLNMISTDLRPTPPQPNCPQSMYVYNESRKMVAAILSVKNETTQVKRRIQELKDQTEDSDKELALKMAERGEGGMKKEEVEEYYHLLVQKTKLSKEQEELTEQYESLKKEEEEEEAAAGKAVASRTSTSKRSRVKRLFVKKSSDPVVAPDEKLSVVACGDWDMVLKEGETCINQRLSS